MSNVNIGDYNRTHGLSNKCGRLYPLWKSIRNRCYTKTSKNYPNYGGRGIVMCDDWYNDFKMFYDWALENVYKEEKTSKGINILTIDRIDVNGNYEPSNCRFVTNAVQARNKRNTMTDLERYRKCVICGKIFEITQRKSNKVTCSKECSKKNMSITHISKKDYFKKCSVCGKTYNAKRGGHYKDAVTCSRECAKYIKTPIWEYNGESHRVNEWAEIISINAHCLYHRKELGWSIEKILTTPLRGKKNA